MGDVEVDFPFWVSPAEQAIIQMEPDPPCSMVLVGRSGTGKTTCAVFRIWARWHALYSHVWLTSDLVKDFSTGDLPHHFKLQAATLNNAEESKRLKELSGRD
ncbi:hypothetical protein ABBQ38_011366 [Trebouxia sp. C0009 RCD-2024]